MTTCHYYHKKCFDSWIVDQDSIYNIHKYLICKHGINREEFQWVFILLTRDLQYRFKYKNPSTLLIDVDQCEIFPPRECASFMCSHMLLT